MAYRYFVYILTSKRNGSLYIGVTNDIGRRMHEHKTKQVPGFTSKYGIFRLVYAEEHGDIYVALAREKQLKKWKRVWKVDLIEQVNPEWKDLSYYLL